MARVQFNLLPDVKIAYEAARRTQSRVFYISAIASGAAITLFIISFVLVDLGQKHLLTSADNTIKTDTAKVASTPNINKILTVQNQLAALPGLHAKKVISSRFFDYLPQLTPPSVGIGEFSLDTSAGSVSIDGTANAVSTVNQFVDTLKFTKFTTDTDKTGQLAFSNVVLNTIDRNDLGATYTITASYAPALLDPAQKISLNVPLQVTTQSVTNAPPVFTGSPTSGGTP